MYLLILYMILTMISVLTNTYQHITHLTFPIWQLNPILTRLALPTDQLPSTSHPIPIESNSMSRLQANQRTQFAKKKRFASPTSEHSDTWIRPAELLVSRYLPYNFGLAPPSAPLTSIRCQGQGPRLASAAVTEACVS